MAYIYLLSFSHRWRYCPFPFSLPLHSQTYITHQQTNMAASRLATRLGDACSATLFLGRDPPKHTYGGPFHTPAQKYIRRGRTLPYPNLWPSADPLPWGRCGAIAHPQHCPSPTYGKQWSHGAIPLFGEAVEPLPIPTQGYTTETHLRLASVLAYGVYNRSNCRSPTMGVKTDGALPPPPPLRQYRRKPPLSYSWGCCLCKFVLKYSSVFIVRSLNGKSK